MGTRGVVLLLEFWGCEARALRDGQEMATVFRRAMKRFGSEIVHSAYRRFDTGGIGGFATAYEGHIAVRSFPEEGHVMVDVYSCNERLDPYQVISVLEEGLKSSRYEVTEVDRGIDLRVEGVMLPAEVEQDGGRDDISGHPATPEGVCGCEHVPQLNAEGESEEPSRIPPS